MNNRTRWSVGLQWGASLWLAYVAFRALTAVLAPLLRSAYPSLHLGLWPSAFAWLMAPAWIAALVGVCRGSRGSRALVAAAICAQVVAGTAEAVEYGGTVELSFALRFFGPMILPLLPLVVRPATEPPAALAALADGRWRDALGRLGGVGAGLVALALIALNRGAYDLLVRIHQGAGVEALSALLVPVLLIALAAVAPSSRPRPDRSMTALAG
jgi:hypothetical protein